MSDRCDRCGSIGEDRRTLSHSCFYKMSEMDVPFEEVLVVGVNCKKVGEETEPFASGPAFTVAKFEEPNGEPQRSIHYTLRVCKRCRSEWMSAIREWFHARPQGHDCDSMIPEQSNVNSGIFIREFGATKEVSQAEWDRMCIERGQPGREPVRVRRTDD